MDIDRIIRALNEEGLGRYADAVQAVAMANAGLRTEVAQLKAELKARDGGVKSRYDAAMAEDYEPEPVERLRFFLSLALSPQDWLDVEPLLNDVQARLPDNYIGVPSEAWQELVDPLGLHFADVLAWLAGHGAVEINTFYVTVTAEYDTLAEVEHDNTTPGIKQAVYEAAKRVVMEDKK